MMCVEVRDGFVLLGISWAGPRGGLQRGGKEKNCGILRAKEKKGLFRLRLCGWGSARSRLSHGYHLADG